MAVSLANRCSLSNMLEEDNLPNWAKHDEPTEHVIISPAPGLSRAAIAEPGTEMLVVDGTEAMAGHHTLGGWDHLGDGVTALP